MTTDLEYLRIAANNAKVSVDPSTQMGSLFVSLDGKQHAAACNQFPFAVRDDDPARWERPLKYSIIEHAERNAIYKAARWGIATQGGTLYIPWAACADCARAIIQAGVARLVRHASIHGIHERWTESVYVGDAMMREAGVEIIDVEDQLGVLTRRDGKVVMV